MDRIEKNPAHLQWLFLREQALAERILASWTGELNLPPACDFGEELTAQMRTAVKSALDVLYYNGDLGDDAGILADGEAKIEAACPNIMDILRCAEQQTAVMLPEVLSRVQRHRHAISEKLLHRNTFSAILGIRMGNGDTHNHGRMVLTITTDAGKFLYKPHSLTNDLILREIAERFFPGVFTVPDALDCGNYGFSVFVENQPVSTAEEALRFYRKLGGYCAVARILGSADMHKENLLCYNDIPVVIDCETIFYPNMSPAGASQDLNCIFHTLYASCLFPLNTDGEESSFLFDSSDRNVSAPVVNGRRQTLEGYIDPFLEGYREVYRSGMARRDDLSSYIGSLHGFPVRIIPVATKFYGKLLRRSRQWKWINSPERESIIRETLMDSCADEKRKEIVVIEAEAILRGDIPLFFAMTDGRDLYTPDGLVCKEYLSETPLDNTKKIIGMLSEEDLELHCRLFRLSLKKVIRTQEKYFSESPETPLLTDEGCLKRAEYIAKDILDDLIHMPDGSILCFSIAPAGQNLMKVSDMDVMSGLHGVGIFLAAAWKNTLEASLRDKLNSVLDEIARVMQKDLCRLEDAQRSDLYGMSTGLTGYLMAAHYIYRYTGKEIYAAMCREIISKFLHTNVVCDNPDIVSGPSALLKLLCLCPELREIDGALSLMNRIADQLLAMRSMPAKDTDKLLYKTIPGKQPISGAGHGQCGIGTALLLVGRILNRPEVTEAGNDALDYEAKLYSPKLRGWPDLRNSMFEGASMHGWCSGAPGIGTNMLQLPSKDRRSMLEQAIDSCTHHKLLDRDHLCCGNCASIDFLLEAGRKLRDPELTKESWKLLSAISHRADRNGGYQFVRSGVVPACVPSLFFGSGGVGYTLLRQIDPDLLSILL